MVGPTDFNQGAAMNNDEGAEYYNETVPIPRGVPPHNAAAPESGTKCAEASTPSAMFFIACGRPAQFVVRHLQCDKPPIAMCWPCAWNNVKNRGASYVLAADDEMPRPRPEADPERSPSTALAISDKRTLANFYDDPASLDQILTRIKAEARSQAAALDISTADNREAINKLRFKVVKSRTALDAAGKDKKAEWAAKANAIDADRRKVRYELEALEAEIEAPLKEWQAVEDARIAANEKAIFAIEDLTVGGLDALSADEIVARYRSIQPFEFSLEFQARAKRTLDGVTAQLREAHRAAKERERLAEEERQRVADEPELARKDGHLEAMGRIRSFAAPPADADDGAPSSDYYRLQIDRLDRLPKRDWEEFQAEANEAYRETRTALVTAMDEALAAEATAQAEREKRLAEEAAAEATRRAEEVGARKAEEDAKAAQALLDAAAERERLVTAHAKEITDRVEADRKRGHIDALDILRRLGTIPISEPPSVLVAHRIESLDEAFDREWEEFGDDATAAHAQSHEALTKALEAATAAEVARESAAKEAEVRRHEEAEKAARREAQAKADAAVEAERQKVAREKAAEDEAAAKRAANVAHQSRINTEAMADVAKVLHEAGISNTSLNPKVAKEIVVALAKGAIRHVRIDYSGE